MKSKPDQLQLVTNYLQYLFEQGWIDPQDFNEYR